MKKKNLSKKRIPKIADFFNKMHRICGIGIRLTLFITLFELIITAVYAFFEMKQGYNPLFAVYIPMMREIFTFTVIMSFLIFLADSLARDKTE